MGAGNEANREGGEAGQLTDDVRVNLGQLEDSLHLVPCPLYCSWAVPTIGVDHNVKLPRTITEI